MTFSDRLEGGRKVDVIPYLESVIATDEVTISAMLISLWKDILEIPDINVNDNFFALAGYSFGGQSLMAIRTVTILRHELNIPIPVRLLYEHPVLGDLAAEIASRLCASHAKDAESVPDWSLLEMTLPGGRRITSLHEAETRYLYLDVFERSTYHRHGITFPATGCVLDVGAHIGLFTLYALECSPDLMVYAFEPCPPLFEALKKNTAALANVSLFPIGLSRQADKAQLTFYPNLTGMSSFHADEGEERALLARILENQARMESSEHVHRLAASEEYLRDRLLASTFTCERQSLSDVLANAHIEHVSLLKVDAQKSELEVLEGIVPADWARIDQVVVEAHDTDGRLGAVVSLLSAQGYDIAVEQDALHTGSVVNFVYAVRRA